MPSSIFANFIPFRKRSRRELSNGSKSPREPYEVAPGILNTDATAKVFGYLDREKEQRKRERRVTRRKSTPALRLLDLYKEVHRDDGTDEYRKRNHYKKRETYAQSKQEKRDQAKWEREESARRSTRGRMVSVSKDDELTARGANPRTGVISPWFTSGSSESGGEERTYLTVQSQLVPGKDARKASWKQDSQGWKLVVEPDTPPELAVEYQNKNRRFQTTPPNLAALIKPNSLPQTATVIRRKAVGSPGIRGSRPSSGEIFNQRVRATSTPASLDYTEPRRPAHLRTPVNEEQGSVSRQGGLQREYTTISEPQYTGVHQTTRMSPRRGFYSPVRSRSSESASDPKSLEHSEVTVLPPSGSKLARRQQLPPINLPHPSQFGIPWAYSHSPDLPPRKLRASPVSQNLMAKPSGNSVMPKPSPGNPEARRLPVPLSREVLSQLPNHNSSASFANPVSVVTPSPPNSTDDRRPPNPLDDELYEGWVEVTNGTSHLKEDLTTDSQETMSRSGKISHEKSVKQATDRIKVEYRKSQAKNRPKYGNMGRNPTGLKVLLTDLGRKIWTPPISNTDVEGNKEEGFVHRKAVADGGNSDIPPQLQTFQQLSGFRELWQHPQTQAQISSVGNRLCFMVQHIFETLGPSSSVLMTLRDEHADGERYWLAVKNLVWAAVYALILLNVVLVVGRVISVLVRVVQMTAIPLKFIWKVVRFLVWV